MKSVLFRFVFIVSISIVLLDSCATMHSGSYENSVVLSDNNHLYKRKVVFDARNVYVFGIGGLKKNYFMERMQEELTKRSSLGSNEELANITISNSTTIVFGVVIVMKYRISGDVIEWHETEVSGKAESESYLKSVEAIYKAGWITYLELKRKEYSEYSSVDLEEFGDQYPQIGELIYCVKDKSFGMVVETTFKKYKVQYGGPDLYTSKWFYKNDLRRIVPVG